MPRFSRDANRSSRAHRSATHGVSVFLAAMALAMLAAAAQIEQPPVQVPAVDLMASFAVND